MDWKDFLLGFAIALWIAIVVLWIHGEGDDDAGDSCCPNCCSGTVFPGGPYFQTPLWIPAGTAPYFCLNDDAGGLYVADGGGFYVADSGGFYVADGGGFYVADAGGSYVADDSSESPAPDDGDLGGNPRPYQGYQCDRNDGGGSYVADASNRPTTVPMKIEGGYLCHKTADSQALVTTATGTPTFIDRLGNVVLVADEAALNPADGIALTGTQIAAVSTENWVYCMVPTPGDEAKIVTKDGTPP